ncbi:hypothetical protein M433DRAFT_154956 [Acidomyces richmondensis BFW]|nr:MAG: hypothetical protein FE78DRAFT_91432 [Acidomyces sp. 'richmondensis']KYG45032.1 hypothetical protein M433DRAFT_154956 [Acidomyces richmondensis BFW]
MPQTIHCIRHAQGYHNLSIANHTLHDPLLTPYGEEQCRDLALHFPSHPDAIIASPIKRTMYTALLTFASDLSANKNLHVIALPELQETSDLPCDTGSAVEDLQSEFAGKPVDLSLVKAGWNSKRMKWAPTQPAIEARAREARVWLANRPEKEIAVVTHGGFLHYLTEDWSDSHKFQGTGWANTEFRSYTLDLTTPENPRLVETPESRRRRRGQEHAYDREEQAQLKRTSTREWEKLGYVNGSGMTAGEATGVEGGEIRAKV